MTPEQQNFNWIKNIIDNTNTPFQAYAIREVIDLFYSIHRNKDLAMALSQQRELHIKNIKLV